MSIIVTKSNFESIVLSAKNPVLIDFWASWCVPCRNFSPIVDEASKKLGDNITVGKIDVDAEPEIAAKYGISTIPTLVLFKNGMPAVTSVGSKDLTSVLNLVNTYK
ncbi:MAG: thioredoxin [Oscillospiraceae bacterium]